MTAVALPLARRAAASTCAALALASLLVTATPARAIEAFAKGPYLQELGATGVTIRFELASASAASVDVTLADATAGDAVVPPARVPTATSGTAPTLYHSLRVDGLEPGRRYRYVARAAGASQSGSFTTAPDVAGDAGAAPPSFSFLIYGDNRTDEVAHASVVRAMLRAPGDFLLHTGDFVADGSLPADWQSFFDVERALLRERPLFGCVGNHELLERSGDAYLRYFGPSVLPALAPSPARPPSAGPPPTARARLFWTFRWASARFFMLNAFDTWVSGEEREWLAAELERSKREPGVVWRVAVLHHGPWSAGPHGKNVRLLAAGVHDMLAQSGVDLVVSGHDHIYERGFANGLRYLVSGGGGAPLYRIATPLETTRKAEATFHFVEAKVTSEAFKLAARRIDGSLIEECGFTKKPSWDCDPAPPPATAAAARAATTPEGPRAASSKCGCRVAGEPDLSGREPRAFVAVVGLLGLAACARCRGRRGARAWLGRGRRRARAKL